VPVRVRPRAYCLLSAMHVPGFSFLMPNYNDGALLLAQIEAVAREPIPIAEFIVCDDGSTDDSIKRLIGYQQRYPWLKILRNVENRGVTITCERLAAEACGELVMYLSANDLLLPGFLIRVWRAALQFPKAAVFAGEMIAAYDHPQERIHVRVPQWPSDQFLTPAQFLHDYLYRREYILHSFGPSVVMRSEQMRALGGYRHELESWSDVFYVREAALRYGLYYIAHPANLYTVNTVAYSGRQSRDPLKMREIYHRAVQCMTQVPASDYFPKEYVRWWARAILSELQRQEQINLERQACP
jgi:glycosyltransferase involved in cell wall biosynthesis